MTAELELRTATEADYDDLALLISWAFLIDVDDTTPEIRRLVHEPDRTHLITDGGRPVATGGVFTREMTVPGAAIPTAHVTGVAVAATHRRRGLLTRVMSAQLDAIRDRGTEPIAALWASEGAIYGRFGYGAAAAHVTYDIPVKETTLPANADVPTLRQVVPRDVINHLADVYERVRPGRPGLSGRPGMWWERLTADPENRRGGMTSLRAVLHESNGRVDGYATWRARADWNHTNPAGEIRVGEVIAATNEAYTALWRFLLSIDLTRTVRYEFAALDEPLPYLVTNPTGLGASVAPSLWVRVVDVPGALAARRYAAPVDVVLEVSDPMLPANDGRWHLVGDGSSAKCEATEAAPDLSLDVRELGAAYLGGTTLQTLASAGLVAEHQPGSLAATSLAFGWHRAPAAVEIF